MASNSTTAAASAYTADFLVLLGSVSAIAIVGSLGNALTMWVTARDAKLREAIGDVRRLTQALACNDFLACVLGLSLYVWNIMIGGSGPFAIGIFCILANLVLFSLVRASLWYLFALAATRFTAVMTPFKHRELMRSSVFRAALLVLPPILGFSTKSAALMLGVIRIRPHPVGGRCTPTAALRNKEGFANVQV